MEEIQQIETRSRVRKSIRVARTSEQIQRWKKEFRDEIKPVSTSFDETSCTTALFELCLKHISCRELWKLFRQECAIDAQNNCFMTNRNDCWQSYEGISWTGLGNCSCASNNSDCHWIRLQTNYNKCIYEITSSGDIPKTVSVKVPLPQPSSTTPIVPYWATTTLATQDSLSQAYTYQTAQNHSRANNWWTSTAPPPAITFQQDEYQREYGNLF